MGRGHRWPTTLGWRSRAAGLCQGVTSFSGSVGWPWPGQKGRLGPAWSREGAFAPASLAEEDLRTQAKPQFSVFSNGRDLERLPGFTGEPVPLRSARPAAWKVHHGGSQGRTGEIGKRNKVASRRHLDAAGIRHFRPGISARAGYSRFTISNGIGTGRASAVNEIFSFFIIKNETTFATVYSF